MLLPSLTTIRRYRRLPLLTLTLRIRNQPPEKPKRPDFLRAFSKLSGLKGFSYRVRDGNGWPFLVRWSFGDGGSTGPDSLPASKSSQH
jgi:hypothetical protein